MYQSILEGIAFEQLFALNSVEKTIGVRVGELVAIGGGATSSLWCHILANISGKNICLPQNTEAPVWRQVLPLLWAQTGT
jgi:sugar (pentulose or hexulose) kinase